jgi:hypothetical protein
VRAILLIGTNFVRGQWMTVLVMTVYLAGIGGVFAHNPERQESRFFLEMHAFYVLFLSVVIAVPALQMERRSRRIVAVLSKGIHRWQYLGGILCGCCMIAGIFCLLVGGIAWMLCRLGGYPTEGLGGMIMALLACCLLATSAGLFYSTFLHPLLATGAASATLILPMIAQPAGWHLRKELFPVAWLADSLARFRFGSPVGTAALCASAVVLAMLFWFGGAQVFARRDVTISPE